ncbi:MAG: glycosyltransferase family protein [Chitinophagales bacterium]
MKILYSIQATGNGHISRAMEILPFLETYGSVDIFLSGANSTLNLDLPIKYRSKGLCIFYNRNGGLSYLDTVRNFAPLRMAKEVRDLPVEKYDIVLNDFESITAMACALKKIPSVNFGHQASFKSAKTPRPSRKDPVGEWILQHYAKASQYIGLHFESYDDFILPPVIKKNVIEAEPMDLGHITVYLSSYCDEEISKFLLPLKDHRFQVFSKEISQARVVGNIKFMPVDKDAFTKSMIECKGIITGAGFETPAEALWLGKKLMVIPIAGQYEQYCNAAALKKMGVQSFNCLPAEFAASFGQWIETENKILFKPAYSTEAIVRFVMKHAVRNRVSTKFPFRGFATS